MDEEHSPGSARSIVFVHIPRTAGSSTHTAFYPAYFPRWYVIDNPAKLGGIRAAVHENFAQGIYVGGHFSPSDIENIGIDLSRTINFCLARDPVDRVLSVYHFIIANPQAYPPLYAGIKGNGPQYGIEFIARKSPNLICNAHCRQLCGSEDAASALEVLHDLFDFAAIQDRLPDLLAALADKARLKVRPELRTRVNTAERLEEASSASLALIAELNQEDRRFYDFLRDSGGLFRNERQPRGRSP